MARSLPTPTPTGEAPEVIEPKFGVEFGVEYQELVVFSEVPPAGFTRVLYDEDEKVVTSGRIDLIEYTAIGDPSKKISVVIENRKVVERHFRGENLYRDGDEPTEVQYFYDGTVARKKWQEEGDLPDRLHRTHGPALLSYFPEGTLSGECYYRNGDLSRIDGPAYNFFARGDGTIDREEWHFRGKSSMTREGHAVKIGLSSDEEIEAHLVGTPLEAAGAGRAREVADAYVAGVRTTEGVIEVLGGAPVEWVRSYESANTPDPDTTPW